MKHTLYWLRALNAEQTILAIIHNSQVHFLGATTTRVYIFSNFRNYYQPSISPWSNSQNNKNVSKKRKTVLEMELTKISYKLQICGMLNNLDNYQWIITVHLQNIFPTDLLINIWSVHLITEKCQLWLCQNYNFTSKSRISL